VNIHRDPKRETTMMAFTSMLRTRDIARAEQLVDVVVVRLMSGGVLKETVCKSENFRVKILQNISMNVIISFWRV
jgi:hypothetical protein